VPTRAYVFFAKGPYGEACNPLVTSAPAAIEADFLTKARRFIMASIFFEATSIDITRCQPSCGMLNTGFGCTFIVLKWCFRYFAAGKFVIA
jgi:hypothetical protein